MRLFKKQLGFLIIFLPFINCAEETLPPMHIHSPYEKNGQQDQANRIARLEQKIAQKKIDWWQQSIHCGPVSCTRDTISNAGSFLIVTFCFACNYYCLDDSEREALQENLLPAAYGSTLSVGIWNGFYRPPKTNAHRKLAALKKRQ